MLDYIIGVDAGGTKTEVVIATPQLKIFARVTGGPANINSVSIPTAIKNITTVIQEAHKELKDRKAKFSVVTIGLAGLDTKKDYDRFYPKMKKALALIKITADLMVVNDVEIALASGTIRRPAMALIAGTGTHCLGIDRLGNHYKSGGRDYILADQGAGYWLGHQGLQAVVKHLDKRGAETLITEMVFNEFDVTNLDELGNYIYHTKPDKGTIGRASLLVSDAAVAGDRVAQKIMNQACKELVAHVSGVLKQMKQPKEVMDLVLVGGVITHDPIIKPCFAQTVEKKYTQLRLVYPKKRPVYGALRICKQCLRSKQ